MKEENENRVALTERMMFIALGLAAIYWFLDFFLDIFLSTDADLLHRLLGSDMGLLWKRLIILCMFIIFGSHAQYTINERRKAAEKRRKDAATRERFQRLLSPDLAEMVVSGQLKVEQGGETRVATVLFVDIRGFTAMSENTHAAEILKMLNEYFEQIVDVVFRYEGTVDKFIGDAMMVIWGAPVVHSDDPARAVRAALDIQSALVEFNKARLASGHPEIAIGIGINTGRLVAGYIGSSRTMSYSVIGDTVNTASRLCDAARAGQVIISENTYQHVRDAVEAVELEAIQAKGKLEPIRVFNVLGEKRITIDADICEREFEKQDHLHKPIRHE